MSNGHTSGLGSGFLGIVLVIVGALVALAAIAFGIGLFFKSTLLMAVLGFVLSGAVAWRLRSARAGLLNGLSGASSALVASLAFRIIGGFTGGLVGVIVGAIAYIVVLVNADKYIPKKNQNQPR